MGVNKVVFGAVSIMDISDSTVTADTLAKGKTAYDKKGDKITGTMESGIDTSDATAVASEILSGKTAYAKGSKVTGTMPTQTLPTPTIEVSSGGLITAKDSLTASGYVASGTKSATKQLTTQAAKTITPTESSQTAVASGRYTTGAVTVGAIPSGYLVGDEIAAQDTLIANIKTALQGKAGGGSGGGGSVETCALNVGGVETLHLLTYTNGIIETESTEGGGWWDNAVKGSFIVCNISSSDIWDEEYSYGYTLLYNMDKLYIFRLDDDEVEIATTWEEW